MDNFETREEALTICPGCNSLVASHDREAKRFGGRHERCAKNRIGSILRQFPDIDGRFRQQIAGATSITQLKQAAEDVLKAVLQLPASVVGDAIARLDCWYEGFVGQQAPISAITSQIATEARRRRPPTGIQPAAQA